MRAQVAETASGFWFFSNAGKQLADLHLNYESIKPYRLGWQVAKDSDGKDKPISYRVEKMSLQGKVKADEDAPPYSIYTRLKINDTLTLTDIPPEVFAYRLGNRSALEWVVDQYRVKTDTRSGIVSDPNQYSDDERYIVDLVEKVVRVSLETVAITGRLEEMPFKPA